MMVTRPNRDEVGFSVNAVTFIGFIAEKFHLEFSFISYDDEGNGLTTAAMVTGVERASLFILGVERILVYLGDRAWSMGFGVVARVIMRTRAGQVTDNDGIIFQVLVHFL
jgi:type IV secretory pathway TrbD component